MAVYAISDLHLSFGTNKPMNIFGEIWNGYEEKIKENWIAKVKEEDTVIIPGDISWGIDLKEALEDFKFIDALPGKKIFLRGNHDYYFPTKTKLEKFLVENNLSTLKILHNNAFDVENYIICGARGWGKTEHNDAIADKKIIAREEGRLILSLENGMRLKNELNAKGIEKDILVALHFPPFISRFESIMKEYGVKICIYGHLHGYGHSMIREGMIDGIDYKMVSCDYTKFDLVKL
ncbi:MAG: metallophosphoesterase [Clostridia bacterium]|nr:metallophosphoesterase [Clostridia bacterium]